MWEPFKESSRLTIAQAHEIAKKQGHTQIEPEHLFLGIIGERENNVVKLLESMGISVQAIEQEMTAHMAQDTQPGEKDLDFAPLSKKVIEQAFAEARALHHKYIGPEHLFLSILSLREGVSHEALLHCGIDIDEVVTGFHDHFKVKE